MKCLSIFQQTLALRKRLPRTTTGCASLKAFVGDAAVKLFSRTGLPEDWGGGAEGTVPLAGRPERGSWEREEKEREGELGGEATDNT